MKKLVLIIAAMLAFNYAAAQQDNKLTLKGDTIVVPTKQKVAPVQTGLKYPYKGVYYDVYINPSSGACFYIIGIKPDGKEDRRYLKKEYSAQIAEKLGITYKGRK